MKHYLKVCYKRLSLSIVIGICSVSVSSQTRPLNDREILAKWDAGQTVKMESILLFGEDNCFQQLAIGDSLFQRIYSKSYKANCTIPLTDLRYLKILHYDINEHIHLGELICHRDISDELLKIFKELYQAHYPIERMVLIDNYNANDETSMRENNTTCFNFRKVAGTKILSKHSTGHAIDINPLYNPYVKKRNGKIFIQPQTAVKYINRGKVFPYQIRRGDLCYRLFKKYGFAWGGDWKSVKDFQHFEK